jgi:hypothetical protein
MEEQYKGHVIQVTTENSNSPYPWKPICRILGRGDRKFIKQLHWSLGYKTPEEAEKVGLMISTRWIDDGKLKR